MNPRPHPKPRSIPTNTSPPRGPNRFNRTDAPSAKSAATANSPGDARLRSPMSLTG